MTQIQWLPVFANIADSPADLQRNACTKQILDTIKNNPQDTCKNLPLVKIVIIMEHPLKKLKYRHTTRDTETDKPF